jgi:hypothetical protein
MIPTTKQHELHDEYFAILTEFLVQLIKNEFDGNMLIYHPSDSAKQLTNAYNGHQRKEQEFRRHVPFLC